MAPAEWTGPRNLRLSWVRVTYRHYVLRLVPGATALPSLFVNVVQPTDDGRVLAARMSPSTAAPGRWQVPGGSVEPPRDGEVLDGVALGAQAARELVEEMGIDTAPDALRLWAVTCGENSSVGLTCLAPALPESALREGFAAAASAEHAQGREPELDDIALVRSPDELAGLTAAARGLPGADCPSLRRRALKPRRHRSGAGEKAPALRPATPSSKPSWRSSNGAAWTPGSARARFWPPPTTT
ncbi:NUDIX domain-containing protein [Streptomyces flavidovirens]|uniref:NUDIX domain-containing protein n=1 Tax=Streptomyces flavidovirens TaxID=67298 RepID=UPI0031342C57